MVKVGFAVSHLKLRLDMRELLDDLSGKYDLHVFVQENDTEFLSDRYSIHKLSSYPRSRWFKLLTTLYAYIGALPAKNEYYIDYSQRKSDRIDSRITRWRLELKMRFRQFFPFKITYSRLLKWLGQDNPLLSDFDVFFGVTDVVDDQLYADVVRLDIPFFIYVVSWDHPPKFSKFLPKKPIYLVWGEEMAIDLNYFHRIPLENSVIVGAGQFNRLHEFVNNDVKEKDLVLFSNYIYYIGTFGYEKLVKQEIYVVIRMCELLRAIAPEVSVVFRPYPLLSKQGFYRDLEKVPNLMFDNYSPISRNTFFDVNDLEEKYCTIRNAKAVVHMGTTMGLEAALLDVPVICFDGEEFDDKSEKLSSRLSTSFSQWHLKKYLLINEFDNVVESYEDLENILIKILKNEYDHSYNEKLKTWIDISGRAEFWGYFYDKINTSD